MQKYAGDSSTYVETIAGKLRSCGEVLGDRRCCLLGGDRALGRMWPFEKDCGWGLVLWKMGGSAWATGQRCESIHIVQMTKQTSAEGLFSGNKRNAHDVLAGCFIKDCGSAALP